jgi:predicted acyltransferase
MAWLDVYGPDFPVLLWIVGVAITLSLPRRLQRGEFKGKLIEHAAKRSAILFGIGLVLAGFPFFDLSTLRIPGVLQRIAICAFIAAVIFLYTSVRGRILWTAALLASDWVLMKFVPVPGYGAGVLTKEGNFAHYVDSLVLSGHMWASTKTWDPEGIVSTIPSVATALFGVLMGDLLRSRLGREEQTAWTVLCGNVLIAAGLLMHPWLPINKSLWTSSFAIFMAGMAMVCFGALFWLIDVKGWLAHLHQAVRDLWRECDHGLPTVGLDRARARACTNKRKFVFKECYFPNCFRSACKSDERFASLRNCERARTLWSRVVHVSPPVVRALLAAMRPACGG